MLIEFLFYAAILGAAVVYIVPLLAGVVKGMLPATVAANFNVPTAYPTSMTAGLWSIVFWGALLGATLWALSHVRPIGRVIERGA